MAAIIGNDGGITLPSGVIGGVINQHSASFPRVVSDVTGFANAVIQTNRLGLPSMSGSASGVPAYNAAGTSPGFLDRGAGGDSLTLTYITGCTVLATAAFSNVTISSDKQGDAAIAFEFVNGDSDALTVTWDETS